MSAILGSNGKASRLPSASRAGSDKRRAISELKEQVERQILLTAELQHRIKNTLAIVSAIANQTMQGNNVAAAREAFAARLATLSNAHDILTRTNWSYASIKDVVQGALAPHRSSSLCIRTNGPELVLPPKQVLALAVAVHELATNATKYGALSTGGTVEIEWSVESIDGVPSFRFSWCESGGPMVVEPSPSQMGFGSRLIEQMLKDNFAGEVSTSYRKSGIECEMITPLANVEKFLKPITAAKGSVRSHNYPVDLDQDQ